MNEDEIEALRIGTPRQDAENRARKARRDAALTLLAMARKKTRKQGRKPAFDASTFADRLRERQATTLALETIEREEFERTVRERRLRLAERNRQIPQRTPEELGVPSFEIGGLHDAP